MDVDNAFVAEEVAVPDILEELAARIDASRRPGQRAEQIELERGDIGMVTVDGHLTCVGVDDQSWKNQTCGRGFGAAGSAQHGAHPSDDFPRTERFGDVVVGAHCQAHELVHLVRPSGHQQDEHIGEASYLS